jgi:hypothetical protein
MKKLILLYSEHGFFTQASVDDITKRLTKVKRLMIIPISVDNKSVQNITSDLKAWVNKNTTIIFMDSKAASLRTELELGDLSNPIYEFETASIPLMNMVGGLTEVLKDMKIYLNAVIGLIKGLIEA